MFHEIGVEPWQSLESLVMANDRFFCSRRLQSSLFAELACSRDPDCYQSFRDSYSKFVNQDQPPRSGFRLRGGSAARKAKYCSALSCNSIF